MSADTCRQALVDLFVQFGGKIIPNIKVTDINLESDQVQLKTESESFPAFHCDKLVVTCGAWVKELMAKTGLNLPLVPIKVDVPYWKVKDEFEGKYNFKQFPAGIYDKGSPQRTIKDTGNYVSSK